MDVTINIDHVEKVVSVVRDDDGFLVTIEGCEYRVSDVYATDGTVAFLIDHVSHIAHVSNGDQGMRISLGGRNYQIVDDDGDSDRPADSYGATGDGRLEAPMPGTIVAVYVSEGDPVTPGQAVIVLESMKMQNEITTPVGGVVRAIHCRPGEQVGFGDVLAVVEAAEPQTR